VKIQQMQQLFIQFINYVWEEKRGTTFRSSTDEIFETLTWNNKVRSRKESLY
jgi:hypothetical protein